MSGKFYKCPVNFEYLQDNCPTDFGLVSGTLKTCYNVLHILTHIDLQHSNISCQLEHVHNQKFHIIENLKIKK